MDPCPFVRILVGNLALKFPVPSVPSSPCFCKIKLHNFPSQFATIPTSPQEPHHSQSLGACFNLNKSDADKISKKKNFVRISVYSGRKGATCWFEDGKFVGRIKVPLDLGAVESKGRVFHNGWVGIGGKKKDLSVELYASVRAEPDPRFVFQFEGEPECSPQVFQVQGNVKQPVFTCNFEFRNSGDSNLRSRSSLSEPCTSSNWIPSFYASKEKPVKERKGWSIIIHDLSGSPVAAASMATPFCPSPGTDRVSKSKPGAWLILRPGQGTWKPWGRLEAWREGGAAVGYSFNLLPDATTATAIASATISTRTGGKFCIDMTSSVTPVNSPHSSCDFGSGFGSWSSSESGPVPHCMYGGFVMSSTVKECSRPEVEVGVQHVTCTEDAAAFVALAAAMDLSIDACKSFSRRIRKELRQ